MHTIRCLLLFALFLTACPTSLVAGEAEEAFEALFGKECEQVAATRSRDDDVALASKLLKTAKSDDTHADLAALLCEKAHDLSAKQANGYETAVEAMELAAEIAPAKKAACWEKILAIREQQYRLVSSADRTEAGDNLIEALLAVADDRSDAGDVSGAAGLFRRASMIATAVGSDRKAEIQFRSERLAARARIRKQVDGLQARIEADPNGADARNQAVQLCVVELDDPARAATFLNETCDAQMRKYVPAVLKGLDGAPEAACMELARWYQDLAASAGPAGKAAMLKRARGYYERYLGLHTQEDLSRSHAALAMRKIEEELAKLGATETARWLDCLKIIDPEKHTVVGKWTKTDTGLRAAPFYCARIRIPCAIKGGYEIVVKFVRTTGKDDVAVLLPVGSGFVGFHLSSFKATFTGLFDARTGNRDGTPTSLTNGQEYTLAIKVLPQRDLAEIVVTLNGKPSLSWKGPQKALSPNEYWPVKDTTSLYLGASESEVLFKSVRLSELRGSRPR
jgi:hypothetical protein